MVNGTAAITQALQSGAVTSAVSSGTGFITGISNGISGVFGIHPDMASAALFIILGIGIKEFTGVSLTTMAIIVFALFALLKFGIIS